MVIRRRPMLPEVVEYGDTQWTHAFHIRRSGKSSSGNSIGANDARMIVIDSLKE